MFGERVFFKYKEKKCECSSVQLKASSENNLAKVKEQLLSTEPLAAPHFVQISLSLHSQCYSSIKSFSPPHPISPSTEGRVVYFTCPMTNISNDTAIPSLQYFLHQLLMCIKYV